MPDMHAGTFLTSIGVLRQLGVVFGSFIDVGCADGHLAVLLLADFRLLPLGTKFLNLDANALYEPSLQRIAASLGGSYKICAVSDQPGEVTLTQGQHPYWTSPRTPDDRYWLTVHNMSGEPLTVPAFTLDQLATEFRLVPPYLLKLDIQGGEVAALRGAPQVLAKSHAVIVEVDPQDFAEIHAELDRAGLVLFDITLVGRRKDLTLNGFYPVYVNRSLQHLIPEEHWDQTQDLEALAGMARRRQGLLDYIDKKLSAMQAQAS